MPFIECCQNRALPIDYGVGEGPGWPARYRQQAPGSMTEESWFLSLQKEIFIFYEASRQSLGPTHRLVPLAPGVKRP
jgi:hypothetical protein